MARSNLRIISSDTHLRRKMKQLSSKIRRLNNLTSLSNHDDEAPDNQDNTGSSGGIGGIGSGGGVDSGTVPCGNSTQNDNNLWQIFPIAQDVESQMELAYKTLREEYKDASVSRSNLNIDNITHFMMYQDLLSQRNTIISNYYSAATTTQRVSIYYEYLFNSKKIGWINCKIISVEAVGDVPTGNFYISKDAEDKNGKRISDSSNNTFSQIDFIYNKDSNSFSINNAGVLLERGIFEDVYETTGRYKFTITTNTLSPIIISSNECSKYSYTYEGKNYTACSSGTPGQGITTSKGCYIWKPPITLSSGSGGTDSSNSGDALYSDNTASNGSININNSNNYSENINNSINESTTRKYAASGR